MMKPSDGEIDVDYMGPGPVLKQHDWENQHQQEITIENDEDEPISSFELEQSLPTVAEMKGMAPEVEEYYRQSRLRCGSVFVIIALSLGLVALVTGLSVASVRDKQEKNKIVSGNSIGNGSGSGSGSNNNNPVTDLGRRHNLLKSWLQGNNVSSLVDLEKSTSPQHQAANFIALTDSLQLDIPHSSTIPQGYQFITRYVLAVLYFATDGDNWVTERSFLSERPTCEWNEIPLVSSKKQGVICNDTGMILHLSLPRSGLKGTLPTELALLTTLRSLSLEDNQLSGSIPWEYRSLIMMEHITMSHNQLTSSLPQMIGQFKGLESLELSHNALSGSLPDPLGSLQFLEFLALDNNRFTGSIDHAFDMTKNMNDHGLSQLKYLYLENNLFEGELSSSFLYSDVHPPFPLTMLDISNNKFSGSLPPHLFDNMPYLTVFDANNNDFAGNFPTILKPNEKLQYLAMHGNRFSGEVSGLLPFLEHLTHLDVSQNQFSEWHIDLGALTNLNYLFLAENDFPPGPIPLFLRSLTNLQELSLKSTQRTGVIPPFFANMTELVLLDLDHNTIQGTILSELGLLSNLEFLLLNRNKLSGTVPTELGQLSALQLLFLDDNNLSGDLDSICTPLNVFMVADCGSGPGGAASIEIRCSCCEKCCSKNVPCNDATLIPNDSDPTWQSKYQRFIYKFGLSEEYHFNVSSDGGRR